MLDQTQEITRLTQKLATDNLALWSDEKRKTFVDTFDARVRVARFILLITAEQVVEKATSKHYISAKHLKSIKGYQAFGETFNSKDLLDPSKSWNDPKTVGDRPIKELTDIAKERADEIISHLPRLNDAVRIISPEVSKMIEQRAKLLEKGKELVEQTSELAGSIDMDDLDQGMTLEAFRKMIKDREKKRMALLTRLDEIGEEGSLLDGKINKFLYDGLPGLSEAVIRVVNEYMDRATGFSSLNRRIAEQVHFGDSEAAMQMLKTFEKDEATISDDIKAQFDNALNALKLAAKKGLSTRRTKKLKA